MLYFDVTSIYSNLFSFTVKICNSTEIQLDHGTLSHTPHYIMDKFVYIQGVEVSFGCESRYRLVGNRKRRCLETGRWSGTQPRCGKGYSVS